MATEQEELKLTVELNDQASAQLANLQQQLLALTGITAPAAHALAQLSHNLKGAGGHAQGMHGGLAALARGGIIGGAFFEIGRGVEKMAKEFLDATLNIKRYADETVRLQQQADRASTSMAQFQRNMATFRESGISADAAAKNIQGFADALGDLQREASRITPNLLAGLRGAEFEDMRNLLNRIATTDKETAIREIKKFGEDIRAYWASQGQAERGALSQREFYAQFKMPDLDKLRDDLESITPDLERMYARRRDNAERLQTALNKMKDTEERSVKSVQSTALYLLPITEAAEFLSGLVEGVADYLESWEESIGGAAKAMNEWAGGDSVIAWVLRKIGFFPERTRQDEINESGEQFPEGVPLPRPRPQTQTWRIPLGGAAQQFVSGGETGSAGPGSQLDIGSLGIPSIGDLLKGATPGKPIDFSKRASGLSFEERMRRAGVPMSRNVIDIRGEGPTTSTGDAVANNTLELGGLIDELRRLNDYLTPLVLGPEFHNAPQGGARGESNPVKIPPNARQPGGGSAAEARPPGASDERKYSTIYYTGPKGSTVDGRPGVRYTDPDTGETYTDRTRPIGPAASGMPDYIPGIAVNYRNLPKHGKETLAGYYLVTPKEGPNAGKTFIFPHSDLGPGGATPTKGKETLDYNAPAAKMVFGSMKESAIQGGANVTYIGKTLPENTDIGLQDTSDVVGRQYALGAAHQKALETQLARERDAGTVQVADAMRGYRSDYTGTGTETQVASAGDAFGGSWGDIDQLQGPPDTGPQGQGPGTMVTLFGGGGATGNVPPPPEEKPVGPSMEEFQKREAEQQPWKQHDDKPLEQTWGTDTDLAVLAATLATGTGPFRTLGDLGGRLYRGLRGTEPINVKPADTATSPSDPKDALTRIQEANDPDKTGGGLLSSISDYFKQSEQSKQFQSAAQRLDRDATKIDAAPPPVEVDQNGGLSVDVAAPAGTKVTAKGEGVFNKTETNRSIGFD